MHECKRFKRSWRDNNKRRRRLTTTKRIIAVLFFICSERKLINTNFFRKNIFFSRTVLKCTVWDFICFFPLFKYWSFFKWISRKKKIKCRTNKTIQNKWINKTKNTKCYEWCVQNEKSVNILKIVFLVEKQWKYF